MNAQQLPSKPVQDSINSLKPGNMPCVQLPAIAPKQAPNSTTDDELHAILWDNVYSGH
jgi:hypothetical protein